MGKFIVCLRISFTHVLFSLFFNFSNKSCLLIWYSLLRNGLACRDELLNPIIKTYLIIYTFRFHNPGRSYLIYFEKFGGYTFIVLGDDFQTFLTKIIYCNALVFIDTFDDRFLCVRFIYNTFGNLMESFLLRTRAHLRNLIYGRACFTFQQVHI